MISQLTIGDEVFILNQGAITKTNITGIMSHDDGSRYYVKTDGFNSFLELMVPTANLSDPAYYGETHSKAIATTKVAMQGVLDAEFNRLTTELNEA